MRLDVALCGDGVDIVDLGSNCGHSSIFGVPTTGCPKKNVLKIV